MSPQRGASKRPVSRRSPAGADRKAGCRRSPPDAAGGRRRPRGRRRRRRRATAPGRPRGRSRRSSRSAPSARSRRRSGGSPRLPSPTSAKRTWLSAASRAKSSTERIGSRPLNPPSARIGSPVAMMIGAAWRALTAASRKRKAISFGSPSSAPANCAQRPRPARAAQSAGAITRPQRPHAATRRFRRSAPAATASRSAPPAAARRGAAGRPARSRGQATGGLSRDTKPPGSNALKKKLCQLCTMLRTPAK